MQTAKDQEIGKHHWPQQDMPEPQNTTHKPGKDD